MIVKTSTAGHPGFDLLKDMMVERVPHYAAYSLFRVDLRFAIKNSKTFVPYNCMRLFGIGWIKQGITQRHKKFISIGCMRFVGVNRVKLIRWAKAGK